MRLFVYGTRMDPDMREVVLGGAVWRAPGMPARLAGYRRDSILGGRAPALVAHPGGAVDGELVDGLDETALARAVHFEGTARYGTRRVAVVPLGRSAAVEALAFLPGGGVRTTRRAWDLATWRRRHKVEFLRLAQRHMAAFPARIAVRAAAGGPA